MKRNVSVTCSNHERSCTMTARACIHTATRSSRACIRAHMGVPRSSNEISARCLARLTRTCMREITGWLTATLSCRFDYILFPLSLSRFLSSFPVSRTHSTRVTYPLGGEKIKKKKKNTNGQCRRSARFFGSTLNAFQARRKKLTVRHRLLTGKPLAWLDTVLFSCAHVPRSAARLIKTISAFTLLPWKLFTWNLVYRNATEKERVNSDIIGI